MPPLLQRILKSGAIAGGVLAVGGFAISYLVQSLFKSQRNGSIDFDIAVRAGLLFGAIGFGFAVLLELLTAGWRSVFPKKPTNSPSEPTP
jgi:hypothetical protein